MTVRVLFAGGGSGGHVFPLLSVAEALRRERRDAEAVFVGTARGMEATILPARGETLHLLDAHPIKGGGLRGALRGISTAAAQIPAARALVRTIAPDVVLSIGGYAAGSISLAARTLGVPVALLEPNCVLGLANRLMTPLVARAYVVFPETAAHFRPSVVKNLGMPLRAGFTPSPYEAVAGRARVLVLGGSQGAQPLNEAMPEAMAILRRELPDATIFHQAGKGKDEAVRAAYAARGLGDAATVQAFVDDVPAALREADVVVARAGAGSVSEICAVGRAAIFVPFPFAADDHQRKNAEALAAAGAAVALRQEHATVHALVHAIAELSSDDARRVDMADHARARGVPDSALRIADDVLPLHLDRRAA